MKLIYTGDFERLKDFGYDYESVLEVYYKMIIPQKWKILLFNEMPKARVINIAKDKKIITKKMDNWLDWNERETLKKDIKDLIQAGLVKKEEEDKSIIEKITLREFFDLIEKEDYPDYVIYYGEKYVKKMAGESLCDYISKDYSYLMLDIVNRNFLWNLLEEEIEICRNRKEDK